MLAYIKGELAVKARGYVVIDVDGLGYKVFMSDLAMENIGNIGEIVKVHTYYRVMEDDISIFGFNTSEELRLFELLISVSGVGAKTAITMLGTIKPEDFAIAIISNDINTLKKLPGIGAKTAQRIVLELKDKLKKEKQIEELSTAVDNTNSIKNVIEKDQKLEEAFTALQVLGYSTKDIEKVMEKIDKNLSLEEIIRNGIKELSKK
ncbi:MAG TPA: Holliday junction branch migration protein RuvA [Clostridiales bacterium]|nr:Holliday junction branch migration protein RuvA [Clostridiales bacterium]